MNTEKLQFFEDLEKNRELKIGICSLIGKISSNIHSHKGGWPVMIKDQLIHAGYQNVTVISDTKTNWEDFDVMLIEHGMEFKGVFNIFGGANDDLHHQINRIFSKNVRMYSLHVDMPDISELVKIRLRTGTPLFKTLESKIQEIHDICSRIPRVDFIQKTDHQILGDSHSFSLYVPGATCTRHDGQTLHGALKKSLKSMIFPWTKKLTLYFGNIDVRHHLMRQQNPIESINQMMEDLENQVKDAQTELGLEKITIRHVLPIENESRKIPKTGWYKGMPFFGKWEERAALSKYINMCIDDICERNGWTVIKNSSIFFNIHGELNFLVMEKPQSVHLSREYHMWNYETRELNKKVK